MYKSSLLNSTIHGFFTRRGGVSQPPYDTLSFVVNKGDSVDNVRRNRELAMEALGKPLRELVTVNQVHGTNVVIVDKPWVYNQGITPEADVIITQNPNVVLGVFTADCVPVLLYDEATQTIGVVHSGWRGAAKNVVGVALEAMCGLGARNQNIKTAIGPCIAQEDYEVGAEVYEQFDAQYFKPSVNKEKWMFDLPGVVYDQLKSAKVGGVDRLPLNTYKLEDDFFSCRRSFHRGEKNFGCMLSAIGLRGIG